VGEVRDRASGILTLAVGQAAVLPYHPDAKGSSCQIYHGASWIAKIHISES
jgi:hypothetical protein